MSDLNETLFVDGDQAPSDTLERLKNITKMFSGKDDGQQELQKVERISPSEKIKRTFRKFEEIGSSIEEDGEEGGEQEAEEDVGDNISSDSTIRAIRKKKPHREHIPYHEMAEVKDKFEKGLIDANKPRLEKRLDVRVQSGLTSSKKQAFEQGEFERETTSAGNKLDIEKDLIAGLTSSKKQAFEKQQSLDYDNQAANKAMLLERDALAGVATGTKAKFESGQVSDRPRLSICADEIATFLGSGLAQAKRSEILSKIDAEQQVQRGANRSIDLDAEQGIASARRDQLASLANNEYRPTERFIDVTAGLANSIKEQYIADASRSTRPRISIPADDIESGLAKNLATVFEKFDESTVKRTVDMDNDLVDCNVAKERLAMFKNLVNGSQSFPMIFSGDSKIRVDGFRWHVNTCQPMNSLTLRRKHPPPIRVDFSDTLIKMIVRLKIKPTDMEKYLLSIISDEENGNVVRESDKREEVYFEKGQTRQLVEQWKIKQISPERDITADTELVQQGKAKNLVQMWKTFDKENTPPSERRGLRAFTPPMDQEQHVGPSEDDESNSQQTNQIDDKANIESGYARAIREKFLQNAEQNSAIDKRKTLKQITPPPESPNGNRRKSLTPPETNGNTTQYNEEIISIKGQAQSLKNRFIEMEQDAKKVETSASKIKYVPKRFVSTPAPKQSKQNSVNESHRNSISSKTVNVAEKIEVNQTIDHEICIKAEI